MKQSNGGQDQITTGSIYMYILWPASESILVHNKMGIYSNSSNGIEKK